MNGGKKTPLEITLFIISLVAGIVSILTFTSYCNPKCPNYTKTAFLGVLLLLESVLVWRMIAFFDPSRLIPWKKLGAILSGIGIGAGICAVGTIFLGLLN